MESMLNRAKNPTYVLFNYKNEYLFALGEVNKLDKYTNDLLHKLELEHLSSSEKCKLATELSKVRKDRRYFKDIVDLYKPLYDLDNNPKPLTVGTIAALLSTAMYKIENLSKRSYTPKVSYKLKLSKED